MSTKPETPEFEAVNIKDAFDSASIKMLNVGELQSVPVPEGEPVQIVVCLRLDHPDAVLTGIAEDLAAAEKKWGPDVEVEIALPLDQANPSPPWESLTTSLVVMKFMTFLAIADFPAQRLTATTAEVMSRCASACISVLGAPGFDKPAASPPTSKAIN